MTDRENPRDHLGVPGLGLVESPVTDPLFVERPPENHRFEENGRDVGPIEERRDPEPKEDGRDADPGDRALVGDVPIAVPPAVDPIFREVEQAVSGPDPAGCFVEAPKDRFAVDDPRLEAREQAGHVRPLPEILYRRPFVPPGHRPELYRIRRRVATPNPLDVTRRLRSALSDMMGSPAWRALLEALTQRPIDE